PPRDGEVARSDGGGSRRAPPPQESPLRQPAAATVSGRSGSQPDLGLPGAIQPETPSLGGLETNLLSLAVEAARARATLGEISQAMEDVFGRYGTQPTPVSGIYGGAYGDDVRWTRLEYGVAATEHRLGRRPRMLVAKMGQDGHDRGANLVSSMFGDLGFEIVPGPLFQTPQEVAALAIERAVDIVGASSLAAGHKTLIPELIGHLRDAGRADIKVIAGGVIPAQDYQTLRDAGVQAIFGPGTNLIEAAEEVLRLLGHNMAPEEETAE
ncbi:MAG TPA: cobalamin-dependent protein, partial [Sphingomonas sp.]